MKGLAISRKLDSAQKAYVQANINFLNTDLVNFIQHRCNSSKKGPSPEIYCYEHCQR